MTRPIDEPAGVFQFQGRTICIGAPFGEPNMGGTGFAPIREDNDAGVDAITGATPDVMEMDSMGMFGVPKNNPSSRRLMTAALEPAGGDSEGCQWAYPPSGKPTICCGVRVGWMMGSVRASEMAV